MGRFLSILLGPVLTLLVAAPLSGAAGDTVYLGDSLRQLGLRELAPVRGDTAEAERHGLKGGLTLYAEPNREFLQIDGVKVFLGAPIGLLRGHLTITRLDYDKVLLPIFWTLPRSPIIRRIVIDPGHGGKDTGKVSTNPAYYEKAAALDTAARLKLELEKKGFEVILTRTSDKFLDLPERPEIANKLKADLFISLHYNAAGKGDNTSSGIETYCLSPAGQRSTNSGKARATTNAEPGNGHDSHNLFLAWFVQRRLLYSTKAEDRGVRRSRFAVLKPLRCPGILVEGGFVSSRTEGVQIAEATYRQKIAENVAAGVWDYVRTINPAPAKP